MKTHKALQQLPPEQFGFVQVRGTRDGNDYVQGNQHFLGLAYRVI